MNFTGKVVVITGSSSGIGAATAELFAEHGALLTIIGRNEERLRRVEQKCQKPHGNQPLCLRLDLTADGSCEEIVRRTIETYSKMDILINCAGKGLMTSLFDTTMEVFDELVALNLRVPYKLTQLCVPHLKKTKGNIVNVFSTAMRVRPGFLPFAMIRDALARFTQAGAVELASEGVRMNAVRPGITRTNFLANMNVSPEMMNATYATLAEVLPNRVVIEPDEIANMILFVASDCCPNLNAANVIVDGAASMT